MQQLFHSTYNLTMEIIYKCTRIENIHVNVTRVEGKAP